MEAPAQYQILKPLSLKRQASGQPFPQDKAESAQACELSPVQMYDRYLLAEACNPFATFIVQLNPAPKKPSLVNYDEKRLTFGEPEKTKHGGFKIPLMYDGQPLRLQTPAMRSPFGFTTFENKRGPSHQFDLDFDDRHQMQNIEEFFRLVRQVDKKVFMTAKQNRETWLACVSRDKYPDDNLWTIFNGSTRRRVTKQAKVYPPRLTVKCYANSLLYGHLTSAHIPDDPIAMNTQTICKNQWLICSIECTGVWASDTLSIAWSLKQARLVEPPPTYVPGRATDNILVDC